MATLLFDSSKATPEIIDIVRKVTRLTMMYLDNADISTYKDGRATVIQIAYPDEMDFIDVVIGNNGYAEYRMDVSSIAGSPIGIAFAQLFQHLISGTEFYQVFQNDTPADVYGYPDKKGSLWCSSIFTDMKKATEYVYNWVNQIREDRVPMRLNKKYKFGTKQMTIRRCTIK